MYNAKIKKIKKAIYIFCKLNDKILKNISFICSNKISAVKINSYRRLILDKCSCSEAILLKGLLVKP